MPVSSMETVWTASRKHRFGDRGGQFRCARSLTVVSHHDAVECPLTPIAIVAGATRLSLCVSEGGRRR